MSVLYENSLASSPSGRSWADFVHKSVKHGWPSFRDAEVILTGCVCFPTAKP